MRRFSLFLLWISVFLSVMFMGGCSTEHVETGAYEYKIYYPNRENTKIDAVTYATDTEDPRSLLQELVAELGKTPQEVNLHETIRSFQVTDMLLQEKHLILTVDDVYKQLSPAEEVLTRAAIVRTLTQIDGVEFISMKVQEEDLTDALGTIVGIMNGEQFIDNAENEVDSHAKTQLILYFAGEDGQTLVKAKRPVIYNSNISMEKLVVEQLIGGPVSEGLYPTMDKQTRILGVTIKDRICYVNLDEGFLVQMSNVSPEVTIYSLVNSLVELNTVDKVQISINGETNVIFRETYPLSTVFEKNTDIVE